MSNPSPVDPQTPAPMRFHLFGLGQLLCYAVLLVPTVLIHLEAQKTGTDVSRWIELAWETSWTHLLGLPAAFKWVGDGVVIMVALLSFGFYLGALRQLEKAPVPIGWVMFWSALLVGMLVAVVPFHSRDLYGYINRGAEQAIYHVNPYLVTVEGIKNWHEDPMFHEHWIHNPSPYGFLFMNVANVLVEAAHNNFWKAFLAFKLINGGLFLSTGYLVFLVRLMMTKNVQEATYSALLYGWNPFILLHLVGNGHNDGWVAWCILVAFLMLPLARGGLSQAWSLVAMAASILIKYTLAVAMPFVMGYLAIQRNGLALWVGVALSGGLLYWTATPYAPDLGQFPWDRIMDNATLSQHSLHSALTRVVYYLDLGLFGQTVDMELVRKAVKWGLCGLYVLLLVRCGCRLWQWRRMDTVEKPDVLWWVTLEVSVLAIVGLLLGASAKFNAWYIGGFFPLLCLFGVRHFFYRLAVWLSGFQLLAFTPLENAHILNFIVLTAVPVVVAWRRSGVKPVWLWRWGKTEGMGETNLSGERL